MAVTSSMLMLVQLRPRWVASGDLLQIILTRTVVGIDQDLKHDRLMFVTRRLLSKVNCVGTGQVNHFRVAWVVTPVAV